MNALCYVLGDCTFEIPKAVFVLAFHFALFLLYAYEINDADRTSMNVLCLHLLLIFQISGLVDLLSSLSS